VQAIKPLILFLALLLAARAVQAEPFLYVPTYDAASKITVLSVFDTATDTRTGEAIVRGSVGTLAVRGVAFSPAGNRIYAASSTAVSVINTADNQIVAQVDVNGIQGHGALLLNPAGTLLYVTTGTGTTVINTATNTAVGTSDLFNGTGTSLAAFNPAGTLLYRSITTANTVEVVDTASHAVVATIPVGFGVDIAVNLAGTRVYVVNSGTVTNPQAYSVSVIDTATNVVIATIPVGFLPVHLAVNSAGTRVYVTNLDSVVDGAVTVHGTVSVIDTATNTVITTVPAGDQAARLAINPAGTRLYVQSTIVVPGDENLISVIDTTCNTVIGTISQAAIGGYFQDLYMAPALAPPVVAPGAAVHVQVTGMEVTQGIQDLANSVPLVSGRRTFVRVYVKSDGAAIPGVTAILSGIGNIACTPGTCPPTGTLLGPLSPINTVGLQITVSPNPNRSNLDDSFVFELPWAWTQYQSLHLLAAVSQGPGVVPTQSCQSDVQNAPLHEFKLPATLKVQFVRLSYRLPGTFNGITDALVETSLAEQAQSESYIRRTYPLSNLVVSPDYTLFDAGLGTAVSRLGIECVAAAPQDQSMCARNYIANRLAELRASSGALLGLPLGPPGSKNPDTIYGLIPQVPNDAPVPNDPKGSLFFTRGACCTSGIGAGPSDVADYAAHEIGHFLGRQHPVEGAALCGHDGADANFPYFVSLIAPPLGDPASALAGFDGGDANLLISMNARPVSTLDGKQTNDNFDIMGYCKPSWISDYTYNALYSCLLALDGLPGTTPACIPAGSAGRNDPLAPQTGDWLTVFGNITPANTASFITRRVDRNYSPPRSVSGDHSIRLIGMGGAILAEYPFTPDLLADAGTPGSNSVPHSFGQVVPFVTGTQSIQIVDTAGGGTVIGEKAVSANPPTVGNVALQGLPDPATGVVTLNWTASDADGDPLTFDIFFTRDGGTSLQPLMLGLSANSAQVETANLGGGPAQFRVVATDGVHSAHADSPSLTLANKPPKPRILNPGDAATIHVGQLVNLEGAASDPQDGVLGEADFAWGIPGRSLGSGSRISVTDLPVGINQVILTATNSAGLTGTSTATITVKENVNLPGPTLTAGRLQIGWHVAVGESQLQTAALNVGNSGSGNLDFTAQSSASWLTLSAATATAPATLTLTADPAGFQGGGLTQEATVTLTAVGIPAQVLEIPVTLSIGNTFVVGKTSAAAVAPPPPADFAVAASSVAGTVTAGQSAQATLTFSPSNGFNGAVSLSCAGLPTGATCSFSPASIAINGATATSTLTIATATRTAMNSQGIPFDPLAPGGLLLASIGVPITLRRRRTIAGLRCSALLGLMLIGAMMLQGCHDGRNASSSGPVTGTPAGSYTVTITATSGSTTHSLAYALTVN
jgi:YVTN family beta-propeller protein